MAHGERNSNSIDMSIKSERSERSERTQIRNFSIVMAAVFLLMGFIVFMRQKPEFLLLWLTGAAFLAIGIIRPVWLKFLYVPWMMLGRILSWVNTRLILGIIYYGLVTPIGLVMRLCRADPLHRAWSKHAASYWIPRRQKTFEKSDYERLY